MKFSEAVRIACLAVVYMAPIGAVEGAEIRFRATCAPAAGIVCLGDVAEVLTLDAAERDALARVELQPAPLPGEQVVLTSREIADRLALKGINLSRHTLSGASRVQVAMERPAAAAPERAPASEALRKQTQARVRSAIVEYLKNYCEASSAWSIEFTLTEEQIQLVARSSAKPVISGGTEPWTGRQRFLATIATADSALPLEIFAEVAPAAPVVVANRAISRGERLSQADVRLATPSQGVDEETVFHSLELVVGRETTRSLSADAPIPTDSIQAPILVHKRDVVTVSVLSPGIRIRTTGRATQDGALGELILIESMTDKQTFFARVCGPQEAEVYARATQATTPRREATATRDTLSAAGR